MKKTKAPKQYRQGDVFLIEIKDIPKTAKKEKKAGRIVLEYGEVTGHAHAINETEGVDMFLEGARKFLEVCLAAPLTHEEHETIVIPPGRYEVRRQCTWSALEQMSRKVVD